jgi:hypothetical protein
MPWGPWKDALGRLGVLKGALKCLGRLGGCLESSRELKVPWRALGFLESLGGGFKEPWGVRWNIIVACGA